MKLEPETNQRRFIPVSALDKEEAIMKEQGIKTKINHDAPYNPRRVYRPTEGNAWNPLRDWPRNEKCFCGSDKKFKKCHMDNIPQCVSELEAGNSRKALAALKSGMKVKLVPKKVDTSVEKVLDGG